MKRNTLIFFKLENIHEKIESVINLLRKPITLILIIQIFSCPSIIMAMDAERGQEKGDHLSSAKSSTKQDERKDEEPDAVEMMTYEYTAEDIANLIGCSLPTSTSIHRFWLGENDQAMIDTLQNVIYRLGSLYILPPHSFHSLIPCLDSFLQSSFVNIRPEEIVIPYNPGGHWAILRIRVSEKIYINYIDSLLSEHAEINKARTEEVCRSLTPLISFLEAYFISRKVSPIEIRIARTQKDNKACGPIVIENIRDIMIRKELSRKKLSYRDVFCLRDRQRAQLKSVGKELNFGEFLSVSQSPEKSDFGSGVDLTSFSSTATTSMGSSALESVNYYNVESFLRMHAHRLGITYEPESHPLSLSEIHHKDAVITVYSKGESGSIKMYKVYDPPVPVFDSEGTQIFKRQLMKGQEFVPQDKASDGTRTVGFYSISGRKWLCFKQWPEAPGHEIAVRYLYKFLFPEDRNDLPLPASEVILMNDQIFLVSEFIEGENLEQVLRKADINSSYGNQWNFNLEKFQKLVLFSLLTNPEDCRPQNCIVRKKGSNEYEFVLIDNERSLAEEFIVYDDPQREKVETRPHCFLFCFHELLMKPFKIEINEYALANWQQYEEEQLYQYALYEHFKERGLREAKLCLWYSEEFIADTYKKWRKIRPYKKNQQSDLYKKDHQEGNSLGNLFWEISPKLAEIYKIPKEVSEETPTDKPTKFHKGDRNRIPCKQAITVNFSLILERIREIDRGRMASTAPPSAYAYSNISFCSPFTSDLVYRLSEYTDDRDHEDSLTTFDLMDNQSLISRTTLDLHNSWKTDVSVKAISRLFNLTSLNLSGNPITDIGVKAIGGMTNLTFLDLSNNDSRQITNVNTLGQLIKLKHLNLRGNQIENISALGRLIRLIYLNLGRNQVEDISTLGQLINLTFLDLWNNRIINISALGQLIKLTSLELGVNFITDINTLGLLVNLTSLSLFRNQIINIKALSKLAKLTTLY